MARRLPIYMPCRVVLPPSVAANFVRDMRAFHAEANATKRDEIAARQLHVLDKFRLPQERGLRLSDVKQMFLQVSDHARFDDHPRPPRLANVGPAAYFRAMLRKELSLPPEVAKALVRDMRAFFKAKDQLEENEIASRQGWLLKRHLPRRTKLRRSDVKQLFFEMRDQTQGFADGA